MRPSMACQTRSSWRARGARRRAEMTLDIESSSVDGIECDWLTWSITCSYITQPLPVRMTTLMLLVLVLVLVLRLAHHINVGTVGGEVRIEDGGDLITILLPSQVLLQRHGEASNVRHKLIHHGPLDVIKKSGMRVKDAIEIMCAKHAMCAMTSP